MGDFRAEGSVGPSEEGDDFGVPGFDGAEECESPVVKAGGAGDTGDVWLIVGDIPQGVIAADVDEDAGFMSLGIEHSGEVHNAEVFGPEVLDEGKACQVYKACLLLR